MFFFYWIVQTWWTMSVYLEWKTIPEDPSNIWIVMTAIGIVDLPETRLKLQKLQETLDYFVKHYHSTHTFTWLFDFSQCRDFAKTTMLGDLKTFMARNDALITKHLRESYILLRDPAWKFFLNLIFVFRRPTRPYHFKMQDQKLYNALRYRARTVKT